MFGVYCIVVMFCCVRYVCGFRCFWDCGYGVLFLGLLLILFAISCCLLGVFVLLVCFGV